MAPETCSPFDKERKGMLLGEAAGTLIIETLDSALQRNAPIYAEILGYGLSCDAFHITIPKRTGIKKAIEKALKESTVASDQVDYISAHGTGTGQNDKEESNAVNEIFRGKKIPISSIKSMIGHTMGAAAAVEAIACCLAMKYNIAPPTINFKTPDPDCDVDCVPNKARGIPITIAMNNSFAFGGNDSCLILKKTNEQNK
jgi:3-oxoacyl-[acyl-carrier-protein] synthase II